MELNSILAENNWTIQYSHGDEHKTIQRHIAYASSHPNNNQLHQIDGQNKDNNSSYKHEQGGNVLYQWQYRARDKRS